MPEHLRDVLLLPGRGRGGTAALGRDARDDLGGVEHIATVLRLARADRPPAAGTDLAEAADLLRTAAPAARERPRGGGMSTLTPSPAPSRPNGTAQPSCTVRHVHISDRPLVFIPLALAGEANAPLAAMVGDYPAAPRLLIVPEPRDRDQRFAFAAELAAIDPPLHTSSYLRRRGARRRPRARHPLRRRAAAPGAQPGRRRLHPPARPVHPVPPDRGPYAVAETVPRPRPLADLFRRTGRASRLVRSCWP